MTGTIQDVTDYSADERQRIAKAVEAERVDRQWGKEEAARRADISSITWKRVEDGQRVQQTKLRAVEIAFGWSFGSMDRLARGREVVAEDSRTIAEIQSEPMADHSDPLWTALTAAIEFARLCEDRGADPRLARDFIGDAVALMNAAGVAVRNRKAGTSDVDSDAAQKSELEDRRARRAQEVSDAPEIVEPAADDVDSDDDEEPGGSDEHA